MPPTKRRKQATEAPSALALGLGGDAFVSPSDSFEIREIGAAGASAISKSMGLAPSAFQISPRSPERKEVESPFRDSWVAYRAIRLLQEKIASVRVRIYLDDTDEAKEAPVGHPLRRLVDHPNSTQSWPQLAAADIAYRKLCGQAYWFLTDQNGLPINPPKGGFEGTEAWPDRPLPLPVQIISAPGTVVQDKRDQRGIVRSWQYGGKTGQSPIFPRDCVVQFADFDPEDPQRGIGDLQVAMRAIKTAFQAERLQDSVMRGGGYGAFLNRETGIDAKENARQQEDLNEKARDPANLTRLKILNGGKWTAFPNPATAKNIGVFEQLNRTDRVVAGILGVPWLLIGGAEGATYANLGEAWRQFYMGVADYLNGVAAVINDRLISRLSDPGLARCRLAFALDEIEALKEDNTERFKAAAEIAGKGVGHSFDSAAATLGLEFEPSKETSVRLVPATMVTLESILPDPNADKEAAAAEANAKAVQDSALNGAQVTGLIEILTALSEGMITPESAIAVIQVAFPTIDEAEARRIVAGVNEKPPEPAPESTPPEPSKPAKDMDEVERALFSKIKPLGAEERAYFAKSYETRVLRRGDRKVYGKVTRWMTELERAYLARIKRIAQAASAKALAPRQKISDSEFNALLLESEDKWAKLLSQYVGPALEDVFEHAARDAAEERGTISIPMTDPAVLRALRDQRDFLSKGVTDTLNNRVRSHLIKVLGEPTTIGDLQAAVLEHLPELTDELRAVFGTKQARALTIARTESGRASSTARFMQYGKDGVTQLQWITLHDDAVRESHKELDGKVMSYGSEFVPGLRYPRDENGSASQVINCRCTVLGISPEDES